MTPLEKRYASPRMTVTAAGGCISLMLLQLFSQRPMARQIAQTDVDLSIITQIALHPGFPLVMLALTAGLVVVGLHPALKPYRAIVNLMGFFYAAVGFFLYLAGMALFLRSLSDGLLG